MIHVMVIYGFVLFIGKLDTLYETNITHDEEKAGGFGHPFSMPELWGYRNHVTIEDMRVKMEHANQLPNTEILQLFCQKVILNF